MKDIKGLTSSEIIKLRDKYGVNELVKEEKPNPFKKFIGVFKEPMFLLLIVAATVYFILGEPKEGAMMLVFVCFVAFITFIQEWKTEKTMHALKDLTSPQVNVLRDGEIKIIKSWELVPGDIIKLEEGERIPADCEVLDSSNFSVDESILTGESINVFKHPSSEIDETDEYWKEDKLYAGTMSIFGSCIAKVTLTGVNTEYGKIGKAIGESKEELSPLQKKVGKLVKSLAIVGGALCTIVILASYIYNKDILGSILSGVSLAMAIIPEEFPVVLTVFLSMGAYRLAKKNTLMRKVSAVETLGSTTVLCVDKTGTITENKMKVKEIYSSKTIITADNFKDFDISKLCLLACEKDPYDPMEKVIVSLVSKNLTYEEINNNEVVKKYPFDSKSKMMGNLFKEDDHYYLASKGSAEAIIPLCNLSKDEIKEINENIDKMASKGLRVLAIADLNTLEVKDDLCNYSLKFKGLIGLQDPPKEGIKEAIKICKQAGIRVVMITGDYNKTAMAIASEIGLKFSNKAITGADIDKMTEEELCAEAKECDIFSRVVPEQKMKIVKALKRNGEVVAMTGDGVNDAPALKSADIGIAMGKRGTEVAKEAAHMILMDDNFETIVKTVEDGRRVFDNIRKSIVYILIIHIPIACMALFAPLLNLPQLLLPMHIMVLELIIDPTCSIVFEGEKAESYIMHQPPRSAKEPLLTKKFTLKVLLQGITMFLASFLPFHFLIDNGATVELARSFSLVTLIFANVILVLVNRSNTRYLKDSFKEEGNRIRALVNGIAIALMLIMIYVPFMNGFFRTGALSLPLFLLALLLGFISTAWWEIVKYFNNKTKA
ncbi:cation-translocating P-type ATPase [Clostridium sp.]|uniref:cation-translocating P-type ATPase n=1 Tax=Clostridium sp. TaxID=1506 RepID=UPI003F3A5E05